MSRTLLATEKTELFQGDGSNVMSLGTQPVIYVSEMQFVQPGIQGFVIPLSRVVVDSLKGQIVQYSPLELQGVGYVSVFPRGLPIAVTYAVGYGYNPCVAPTWVSSDSPGSGLAPGVYTIGITTATQWGETVPNFQNATTASGSINIVVTPVLGAWKYRIYIAQGANQSANAKLVGEFPVTTFGGESIGGLVGSLTPPEGLFPLAAPTVDTSALPLPGYLREAVRLLALQRLYEQNNPANRGLAGTSSGRKRTQYRSTEGTGGMGKPTLWMQAEALLAPKKLSSVF